MWKKRLNKIINIIMALVFAAYVVYGLCSALWYKTHPEIYAMQSAPWYTGILIWAVICSAVLLICLIVKLILRLNKKK